jgi:dTDP-4-dehydrorhamnose 3,5-epimerase
MKITELELAGLKLITPDIAHDDRGYFLEMYQRSRYHVHSITCDFVQDNLSFSKKGTLRGMHFQALPGQAKLVSVLQGEIFDVVVDIRPSSSTFLKWIGIYLNGETREQLLVPVGFAHGFCVLSETAHVIYKVSAHYDPLQERSCHYADPEIGIQWPLTHPILSIKDSEAPPFRKVL